MDNIGGFLEKFKNILGASKFQKDAVLSIIKKITTVELTTNMVDVKDFVVYAKTSPAVRGHIFMYKRKILEELKNTLGDKAPIDIR